MIMSFDNSEDVGKSAAFSERTVNEKLDLLVFAGLYYLICKPEATTLNRIFKLFARVYEQNS